MHIVLKTRGVYLITLVSFYTLGKIGSGIMYLCSNDENFQLKHHVRIQ